MSRKVPHLDPAPQFHWEKPQEFIEQRPNLGVLRTNNGVKVSDIPEGTELLQISQDDWGYGQVICWGPLETIKNPRYKEQLNDYNKAKKHHEMMMEHWLKRKEKIEAERTRYDRERIFRSCSIYGNNFYK